MTTWRYWSWWQHGFNEAGFWRGAQNYALPQGVLFMLWTAPALGLMLSHMGTPRHSSNSQSSKLLVLIAILCLSLAVIVLGALGLLTTELIELFMRVLRVIVAW